MLQKGYMKTKAKSYRFEETDLALAMLKSGIKKTQKLMDFLLAEYVRDLKPEYLSLPKDFVDMSKTKISAVDKSGKVVVKDITAAPPKTNYSIDTTKTKGVADMEELFQKLKNEKK